jgi:hypothetical protein
LQGCKKFDAFSCTYDNHGTGNGERKYLFISAVDPATGKREIIDPESEFIPGETIIKLYYCRRLDGYVTVPGASLFKVSADGCTLESAG